MITIRPAAARGQTRIDWLDSRHTFSFGEYHDPQHMGFGPLRVINEDRVAPGGGFGTHTHRDMEIITWVLSGALAHKDSLGNGSVIQPGEVQRMSAGTGIAHSEFNHSPDTPVHFLQIWIMPARRGLPPGYEQRTVGSEPHRPLRLIASPDGSDGSATVHQAAWVYAIGMAAGDRLVQALPADRQAWLQVTRGSLQLGSLEIGAGDGAAIADEQQIELRATGAADALLFELA